MATRRIVLALLTFFACIVLAGCAGTATAPSSSSEASSGATTPSSQLEATTSLEDYPTSRDSSFGGIFIEMPIQEFNERGFAFGDSVDIAFSNGYALKDLPYYNGYYVPAGDPLLVGYPGYPYIRVGLNYGDDLWKIAALGEDDTATVTLAEAGKYKTTQEALNITYTDERDDYPSDVAFANFRAMSGGNLKENMLYRGASPVNNKHNRAPFANRLIADAGVRFDFDLADSDEEIAAYLTEDHKEAADVAYFEGLYGEGNVAALNLDAAYQQEAFAQKLAQGLIELTQHEGAVYIHCTEGKDRTGFVCMLLEALAGATYDQIVDDYMTTYDNYYKINRESDLEKYHAIKELNLDYMVRFIVEADKDADLGSLDLHAAARHYLASGGMSDEQIDALQARICKEA